MYRIAAIVLHENPDCFSIITQGGNIGGYRVSFTPCGLPEVNAH